MRTRAMCSSGAGRIAAMLCRWREMSGLLGLEESWGLFRDGGAYRRGIGVAPSSRPFGKEGSRGSLCLLAQVVLNKSHLMYNTESYKRQTREVKQLSMLHY